MKRRMLVLAGSLALVLVVPPAASHAVVGPGVPPTSASAPTSRADAALARLRGAARGPLRVHRAEDGTVHFLSSRDGRALLTAANPSGTPAQAVQRQLDTYGAAFGLDGATSRAVVTRTIPSSTGGSIVRADQVVDGVPVFAGQVVSSLDRHDGLVSLTAATTPGVQVAAPRISEAAARRTALALVARDHTLRVGALGVSSQGRRLYDPALVHETDPLGVRPVWQFQVTHGLDVRETVLVGTGRGEVALHFNDAPDFAQNRVVCDNANAASVPDTASVPLCTSGAARTETSAASSVADVNQAFDNLGATALAYSELDNVDLTSLIGVDDANSEPALMSTVRWCFSNAACPYDNAFWDGTQMVFGAGYAGADDVVGHELTHGYVQHTSNLFALHQSGSLNESLADTIGEIVDHRNNPNGAEDNSAWTIGEDLGDPSSERSMKDPTLHGQPDRMGSPLWASHDYSVDNGDVHQNDGVGNKTAYLISQGGTFDGQSVTGIDGSDDTLAKTGRLYLETIPRLTSGAQYADLGNTLLATCQQLAGSQTGGFTSADCTSVSEAVAATQLSTTPVGANAQAPVSCPSGSALRLLARDDDGVDNFGFDSDSPLWGRIGGGTSYSYAESGVDSVFGTDPDPTPVSQGGPGDPSYGDLVTGAYTVPATTRGTFMNFHHAYLLDYDGSTYYDSGRVLVQHRVNGVWSTVTSSLPWVNGPTKTIVASGGGGTGFSGDSNGYGSSQVDVRSLAGQTIRFVFRIQGDPSVALAGWWIDDARLYSCPLVAPSAARSVAARAGTTSAVVSWTAPASAPSGIGGYLISRTGGASVVLPASARSVSLSRFAGTAPATVTVTALAPDRTPGPAALVTILPTTTSVTTSLSRARRNQPFTVTGRVLRRGTAAGVAGMPVLLQRRATTSSTWTTVSSGTTGAGGVKAWSVRQSASTVYRVVARGYSTWFGSTSAGRTVARR